MGDTDKVKILVVDDVEVNRFTLRDIIKDMGYMPVLTENGEQALKVVEIFPIQLIITDIAMPEMDGYELCKSIKQNPTLYGKRGYFNFKKFRNSLSFHV